MPKAHMPGERFVDEPIVPVAGTADARRMAAGGPGLPRRFRWRGAEYEVQAVLRTWRETGPCRSGSQEQYVRKHWFAVRTASGEEMTLYFERQARSRRERTRRWWLFTVSPSRPTAAQEGGTHASAPGGSPG